MDDDIDDTTLPSKKMSKARVILQNITSANLLMVRGMSQFYGVRSSYSENQRIMWMNGNQL